MDDKTGYDWGFNLHQSSGLSFLGMRGTAKPVMSKEAQLQQLKEQSMQRQIESSRRCLTDIYESESIGIASAEELTNQGEKLDKIESNIDKILTDTKDSQRHLNSIKSVIGGLKNWWSGEPKKKQESEVLTRQSNTLLSQAMTSKSNIDDDRLGLKPKCFPDDDMTDPLTYKPSNSSSHSTQVSTKPSNNSSWQQYDDGLNKNLDLMANGLSNLKLLARGLGDEIEVQNSQIERMTDKGDKADLKIRNQNLQIKHLLNK